MNLRRIASDHVHLAIDGYPEYDVNYRYYVDQLALSLIGSLPVHERVKLFGRLGYGRTFSKANGDYNAAMDLSPNTSEQANHSVLGLGATYSITPTLTARVELQRPQKNVRTVNLGLSYNF